jgi:hypothetical protein
MIRYQTIRRDAYSSSLMGFGENVFKRQIIRGATRTTPTDRHVGSAHDRLSRPLKGEVGAAFSSCIYRIKRFFVKKRLPTPFPPLGSFRALRKFSSGTLIASIRREFTAEALTAQSKEFLTKKYSDLCEL